MLDGRHKSLQAALVDHEKAARDAIHLLLRRDGIHTGRKAGLSDSDFPQLEPYGSVAKVLCNGSQNPNGLQVVAEKRPEHLSWALDIADGPSPMISMETSRFRLQRAKAEVGMARAFADGDPQRVARHWAEIEAADQRADLPKNAIKPAFQLLTNDYSSTPEIIERGILPKGAGMILAGESGSGKSILRSEMALHLALGWDFLDWPIPKARRVLICQFENTERTEAYRLKAMARGMGITNLADNLTYSDPTIRLDLRKKRDIGKALSIVEEAQAEVVIFDPLSSIHNVNENDNIQIRNVLDSVTEISRHTGAASIVIHHFGKPQKDDDRPAVYRTRGGSSIRDWADTLIALTHKKHERKILRQIEFCKVRNGPEPASLVIERDKETFLSRLVEGDTVCTPGLIRSVIESTGGRIVGQSALIEGILQKVQCSKKTAGNGIREAVRLRAIMEESDPTHAQRKVYRIET